MNSSQSIRSSNIIALRKVNTGINRGTKFTDAMSVTALMLPAVALGRCGVNTLPPSELPCPPSWTLPPYLGPLLHELCLPTLAPSLMNVDSAAKRVCSVSADRCTRWSYTPGSSSYSSWWGSTDTRHGTAKFVCINRAIDNLSGRSTRTLVW